MFQEIKILIVDDEEYIGEVLSMMFDHFGYSSHYVSSGQEALDYIDHNIVHLIVCDINMPEMTGLELLKILKDDKAYQQIPVIMLTANQNESFLKESLEGGANDFLTKPIQTVVLKARLNSVLAAKINRDIHDALMMNILPEKVAKEILEIGHSDPIYVDSATVVFTDFAGFTQASNGWSAQKLVGTLKKYFDQFDDIIKKHGLEKLKTIGDGYMYAGGVSSPLLDHTEKCIKAALEIRDFVINQDNRDFDIRIGVDTGSVMAGVIGKTRISYDIWGNTVNLASRMETVAPVNTIAISSFTQFLVADKFKFKSLGFKKVKGMGDLEVFVVKS
ncbi:MAG: response regulator [Candidatus Cloacimonetes bacterium]|nr:response regulator [Candidatus Cloacimonadota bacterium]